MAIFIVAYLFVMAEEFTHLRKSKPVIIAAGIIWGIVNVHGLFAGRDVIQDDSFGKFDRLTPR